MDSSHIVKKGFEMRGMRLNDGGRDMKKKGGGWIEK